MHCTFYNVNIHIKAGGCVVGEREKVRIDVMKVCWKIEYMEDNKSHNYAMLPFLLARIQNFFFVEGAQNIFWKNQIKTWALFSSNFIKIVCLQEKIYVHVCFMIK